MNLHIDKIECLFILFNILISSAKLTSSYKLKHIILAQYIGNSQNGISSNGASLAKVRTVKGTKYLRYKMLYIINTILKVSLGPFILQ